MSIPAVIPNEAAIPESELIQRIQAGEKQLFEQVIRRYNTRLFRIGMSIIKDDAAIEDVMQNAYIKAYENLSRFEGRAGFGTWLVRIMINESLSFARRQHKYLLMEDAHASEREDGCPAAPDNQSPDRVILNKELARILEQSVFDLPEKYRLVFVMREMEQMSVAETTSALELTESNVKVRLNRAKAMLRDKLSDYYRSDAVFPFHLSRCDRIVAGVFASLAFPHR